MIPADKLGHLKAGAQAAAFGAAVGGMLALLMGLAAPALLVCAGGAALVSATSAGIAKELADRADNAVVPGMHGVEVLDAVATAAPGMLVCAACCLLAHLVQAGSLS